MKASLKENFIVTENMADSIFYASLEKELNDIMEAELCKSYEETDAEIIDDCCKAIESIYNLRNDNTATKSDLININTVIKKYNLKKKRNTVIGMVCAAVVAFAVGVTTFTASTEITADGERIKAALGKIDDIFSVDKPTTQLYEEHSSEVTQIESSEDTQSSYTQPISTTSVSLEIEGINIIIPPDFTGTLTSVEDIFSKGLYISVNYTNGKNEKIPVSDDMCEICEKQQDGLTEIKINYKGFTTSFYVTVIPEEKLNPIVINSIYGTFENGYNTEEMRVFAVLSDGSEKEIPLNQCTITTEQENFDGEELIIVTVEYQNCSFQFVSD